MRTINAILITKSRQSQRGQSAPEYGGKKIVGQKIELNSFCLIFLPYIFCHTLQENHHFFFGTSTLRTSISIEFERGNCSSYPFTVPSALNGWLTLRRRRVGRDRDRQSTLVGPANHQVFRHIDSGNGVMITVTRP